MRPVAQLMPSAQALLYILYSSYCYLCCGCTVHRFCREMQISLRLPQAEGEIGEFCEIAQGAESNLVYQ